MSLFRPAGRRRRSRPGLAAPLEDHPEPVAPRPPECREPAPQKAEWWGGRGPRTEGFDPCGSGPVKTSSDEKGGAVTLTSDQKRRRIAAAALAYFPPLAPDDRAARRRQGVQAWKAVTVAAAVDGMDAAWFGTCLEALGLLPYDAQPRGLWGQPLKTRSDEEGESA